MADHDARVAGSKQHTSGDLGNNLERILLAVEDLGCRDLLV